MFFWFFFSLIFVRNFCFVFYFYFHYLFLFQLHPPLYGIFLPFKPCIFDIATYIDEKWGDIPDDHNMSQYGTSQSAISAQNSLSRAQLFWLPYTAANNRKKPCTAEHYHLYSADCTSVWGAIRAKHSHFINFFFIIHFRQ